MDMFVEGVRRLARGCRSGREALAESVAGSRLPLRGRGGGVERIEERSRRV